jgi:hypothetical protein
MNNLKNSELIEVATNYAGKVASAESTLKPFDLNLSIYPLSSGGEPFMARALRSGDSINLRIGYCIIAPSLRLDSKIVILEVNVNTSPKQSHYNKYNS